MQHLREVQGFRSILVELANLLFSFRDSDSPTAPTKGAHGGARKGAGRRKGDTRKVVMVRNQKKRHAANQRAYEERMVREWWDAKINL